MTDKDEYTDVWKEHYKDRRDEEEDVPPSVLD